MEWLRCGCSMYVRTILGVGSPQEITKEILFLQGVLDAKGREALLRAVEKLASEIELKYTKYTTSSTYHPVQMGSSTTPLCC